MGFNLDRQPKNIHSEIKFIFDDEEFSLMAVFKPLPTGREVDHFIRTLRTLQDKFEADPDCELMNTLKELAEKVFVGWVNPPGREDLWMTSADGSVLDCNPVDLQRFLEKISISMQICQQYVSIVVSGGAALGNSKPSPASGAPPDAVAPNPTD